MIDIDNRIKKLRETLKGFRLVTLHYKDGTRSTVKPEEAARQIIQRNDVAKISGSENAPGRLNEILQAVIDLKAEP